MRTLFQHQPKQLRVRVRTEPLGPQWFDQDADYQTKVDTLWKAELKAAKRAKRSLFDGPILRLDRFSRTADGARVNIDVSPTSYKHFMAGRRMMAGLAPGRAPWQDRVTPIGSQTYLLTRDHQFILFRRSKGLSVAPGKLRGLGGTSDLDGDLDQRGLLDLKRTALREAGEELDLSLADIGVLPSRLRCAGMAFNPHYWMATAVHWVRTNLSASQAVKLPIEQEHDEVVVLSKADLRAFVRASKHDDPGIAHYLGLIQADIRRQNPY